MGNLTSLIAANTRVTPHQNRSPSEDIFADFTDQDLSRLVQAAATALRVRGVPPVPASLPPPLQVLHQPCGPNMWDYAKIEQIICTGLKPQYDGTPDKLLPTLNLTHIRCRNEVWSPATYITQDDQQVDMLLQFSKVREKQFLLKQNACGMLPMHLTKVTPMVPTNIMHTYLGCFFVIR
jgi:hypothetical protein